MSGSTVPSYAEDWSVPGYTEERELGRGASGKVVEAINDLTGQRVAIKYLSAALVRDPRFMWGFRTEAQMLKSLGVPQVVQVYDYVEQPGQGAAIIMELVDGVSLHQMLVRRGPTGPGAALAVLKGSLLGLAAAHTLGIVHRDYKPENILVDAAGSSKLADFGVAVKVGKQTSAAGTPLYMAPEQWQGAPASPSADVYAATAVFFECLTGKPPFSGKQRQLQEQHVTAPVPLDRVDAPLQGLIARGMAKNPAGRPQSAIAFVAELEAVAGAAYGPDWEERGRGHLAVRVAALLTLLLRNSDSPGSSGTSYASTWLGGVRRLSGRRGLSGRRRKTLAIAAIATAAVVVVAAAATAITLDNRNHQGKLKSSSQVATVIPTLKAVASVTPPVATSQCTAPTSFGYTGAITATTPGIVKYQWVYSSGKPGPVRTVSFTGAGARTVGGGTVKAKQAGGGWAELKVLSPVALTSNKASYELMCGASGSGQVKASKAPALALAATAAVSPASQSLTSCSAAAPTFTFTGTISDNKAGSVGYHWKLPSGNGATQTVKFTEAGSRTVTAAYKPASDSVAGSGTLVVTGPAGVTSNAAAFTLTCGKALTLTDHASATATVGTAYSGTVTVSGGKGTYTWAAVTGLPAGLKASASGATLTISGTPTTAETATATLTARDTESTPPGTGTTSLTITVAEPEMAIASDAATTATVGRAYSGTATVTGGNGSYTWAAVAGLPAGLKASASGATLTISGTPTTAETATATLTARDTESTPKTATTSLTITVSAARVTITTGSLPSGTARKAYSAAVTATGGTGTLKWSATGLPTNLTIDSATGTISGTPTASGTFAVTVTVTAGTTASASFSIVIGPAATTSPSASVSASASAPASPKPSSTVVIQ